MKPTHISNVEYPSDNDGYNVLNEFKSLDEFSSFDTSHNRCIQLIEFKFVWIKCDDYD